MRSLPFSIEEYYHVCNHGVLDSDLTFDSQDSNRFVECLSAFNSVNPRGSLRDWIDAGKPFPGKPLVEIVAYCLNPNHFHILLRELEENGTERFMHKITMGYARYINAKYHRRGVLFQGPFRATHVDSDEYLLYLSVYVNLNHKVHRLAGEKIRLVRTSWSEYVDAKKGFCEKDIILTQFKDIAAYKAYADEAMINMQENKDGALENDNLFSPVTP